MNLKPRKKLPDVGELVVGTVIELLGDMGAYVELNEYDGLRAFLPWSEVTSRSIRSITEVIRVGQRVVLKVIRVNKAKGEVDVSLKRVMEGEARRRMAFYKRYVKATTLVLMLAEKLGFNRDKAYEEVIWRLEDKYGDPMFAFERAVLEGSQVLRDAGVPDYWIEPLMDIIRSHVEVKSVRISGIMTLKSTASDGIERIRSVLLKVKSLLEGEAKIKARIYTVGSPRYRVDLEGHDYKILESIMKRVVEEASNEASRLNVEFSFERIKE